MIAKLAIRLAASRDRASRWRQLSLVTGAAVCTAALLFIVTFHDAADAVQQRLAQRSMVVASDDQQPEVLFLQGYDSYRGHQFEVRYIQPLKADAPTPPGVDHWPEPGSYVVSSALKRAIDGYPDLWPRYSDSSVIGDDGTTDRNEWLAYRRPPVGTSIDSSHGGLALVGWGGGGDSPDARADLSSILLPCAALLGLPALFLLWGALRTGAPQRDRRLLLLHWMGMRRTAAASLAAVECSILVLPGAALGALLWSWLGRSVGWLPITGFRPVPGDLAASPVEAIVTAGVVVVGAALYSFGRGLRVPGSEPGTRPWAEPKLSRLALVPSVAGAGLVVWQFVQPPASVSFALLIATPLLLAVGAALMAPFVVRMFAARIATSEDSVVSLLAGRAIERDPAGFARPIVGLGVFAFLALVGVHLIFAESRHQEVAVAQDRSLQSAIVSIVADDANDASVVVAQALPGFFVAPIDRETFSIASPCSRFEPLLGGTACRPDGQLSDEAAGRLRKVLALSPDSPVRIVRSLDPGSSALVPGLVVIGPLGADLNTLVANAVTPLFLTVQVLTSDDFTLRASGAWGWIEAGLAAGAVLTALGLFITAVDRSIRDPMLTALTRLGASVRVRRRIYVARFVVAYAVVMSVLLAAGGANGVLILRASRESGYPIEAIGGILLAAAVLPVLGAVGLVATRDWSQETE